MKKLLLLVGLVVFLTPMVVSAKKQCGTPLMTILALIDDNNLTPKFETLDVNKIGKVWLDGVGWAKPNKIKKILKCRSKIDPQKIAKKREKEKKVEQSKNEAYEARYDACIAERNKNVFCAGEIYGSNRKGTSIQKKKTASFDELAISLGCGIKRKDVDDCVKRWLPNIAGTSSLTLAQINEVKKDRELMGEIVFAIEEIARAQNQSSNQEQAQNTDGYYKEQSNGQYVWVDTRSGYEKFTDRFCVGCSAAQVYWINRATKNYFQGGYLSGFENYVLSGTNARKVIRIQK